MTDGAFVWLWTDLPVQGLLVVLLAGGTALCWHDGLRSACRSVLATRSAMAAAVVLLALAGVAGLDSVHLQRAPGMPVESLLDRLLARPRAMREGGYSRPLAWHTFHREPQWHEGRPVRAVRRLDFGGAHLVDPPRQWAGDVARRAASGAAVALAGMLLVAAVWRRWHGPQAGAVRAGGLPWRTAWWTAALLAALAGSVAALVPHYHVLGTDRTGQDLLVQALHGVRTAWVVGLLATLVAVPLGLGLGLWSGWCRGGVDALVQGLCAVLQAVPNVLLVAAGLLLVQARAAVQEATHAAQTLADGLVRADAQVFLLGLLLGATGWVGLCRLVRARVRQVRVLPFVEAAIGQGLGPGRLLWRHVLPQVLPLVLVTAVLDLSALVLYEAVLGYVGLGVDPAFDSFGAMVQAARAEWSRAPVVWWPTATACIGMVTLVLALNLLADGLRRLGGTHAPD